MKLIKLLHLGLMAVVMALGLSACGGSGSDSSTSSTDCVYNTTSQLCAGTSTATSSGSATGCPSLSGYQAIQAGMSYAQVVSVLGCQGSLDQTAKRDNVTQSYTWGEWATNYYGNGVYVVFINGGVSRKSARFNGVSY